MRGRAADAPAAIGLKGRLGLLLPGRDGHRAASPSWSTAAASPASSSSATRRSSAGLPGARPVVLEEDAVEILARLAADDRVVYARRASIRSSGAWKPSSASRVFVGPGRSSVIQPVSTLVIRMPLDCSSLALVRVSMFSAALAMFVWGWPGPL